MTSWRFTAISEDDVMAVYQSLQGEDIMAVYEDHKKMFKEFF